MKTLGIPSYDQVEATRNRTGHLKIVLEVVAMPRNRILQLVLTDFNDGQPSEATANRPPCGLTTSVSAADVVDIRQSCGGDMQLQSSIAMCLKDCLGLIEPRLAAHEEIQNHIGITQNFHQPYFRMRSSSSHRSTSSSVGGVVPLSRIPSSSSRVGASSTSAVACCGASGSE